MTVKEAEFHLMDALQSPVLTHDASWADCIPQRLLNEIRMERLCMLMQHKEYAGDAECVAFMMTRIMNGLLSHDWVEIYIHLGCSVCESHWKEDHWEELQAQRKLTEYQEAYLLKGLRNWIYKRRREHLRKSLSRPDKAAPEDILTAGDIFDIVNMEQHETKQHEQKKPKITL
jgi:hypothetical protein